MKYIFSITAILFTTLALFAQPDDYIAYYPLDGNTNDQSGNGHNGTNNGAVPTEGRFNDANGAYLFDGTAHINIGTEISGWTSAEGTIAAWINTTKNQGAIVHRGLGFRLDVQSNGTVNFGTFGMSNDILQSTTIVADGNWHFVAGTIEGSVKRVYVDGVLENEITNLTGTPNGANGDVQIGANPGNGQFTIGSIDEVTIYDRGLSSVEVLELYEGVTYDLIAHYPLDGNTNEVTGLGSDAEDIGNTYGTDRHGNPNGAASFDGDDYIIIPSLDGHPTGEVSITYSAWVNPSAGSQTSSILFVGERNSNGRSSMILSGGTLTYVGEGNDFGSGSVISINEWTHVAITKSGVNVDFYVNGELVADGSVSSGQNITSLDASIGSTNFNDEFFVGLIDDVKVHKRALSATEVSNLYNDVTDGLLVDYPFDGNVLDQSGQENHGTLFGATPTEDRFGNQDQAYQLDGAGSYISGPAEDLPIGSEPRTVMGWMRVDSETNTPKLLFEYGSNDVTGEIFGLGRNSGNETWFWGHNADLNGSINGDNLWHHYAVTYDGTTVSLYLDGELDATANLSLNTAIDSDFSLGTVWSYSGAVDEVRVYNRVLSGGEISEIYADQNGDFLPTNLTFFDNGGACFKYQFDEAVAENVTGYLHIFNANSEPSFVPEDGVEYPFNLSDPLPDGSFVLGSDQNTIKNLCGQLNTTYSFEIWSYSGDGTNRVYSETPLSGNVTTLGQPTIESFSPLSGAPGSIVTITGTNFSESADYNEVFFNGEQATVLQSNNNTSLSVEVPINASTGPISINVGVTEVTSDESFTVENTSNAIISYFPFNNGFSDASGNGNNGTNNGVTFDFDRFGNGNAAASFDGENNYVQTSNALSIGSGSSTVTVWVKVPEVGSGGLDEGERVGIIMGNYPFTPNAGFEIFSAGEIRYYWNGGEVNLLGTSDLRDGQWHFLSYVRDSNAGQMRLYVDGSLEVESPIGSDVNFTQTFKIGGDYRSGNDPSFHGLLDDLTVYNEVLTSQELADLYGNSDWLQLSSSTFKTTWEITSNNESITIPTVNGETYDYIVDWGDGTVTSETGDATHVYVIPGTYSVAISGTFPRIFFRNSGMEEKLLTVEQWGDIQWNSMNDAFFGCVNLTVPATDAPDLSNVISVSQMFFGCTSFDQSINHWDVSNVQFFGNLFGASLYNQPLNDWVVSSGISFNYMFQNNSAFNQPLDNWDLSSATDLYGMFAGAASFNQDISNWNTGNVTTFTYTFAGTEAFNQAIGGWDVSSVQAMVNMFNGASQFDQNLSAWDISSVVHGSEQWEESMSGMFGFSGMSSGNYERTLQGWSTLDAGETIIPQDITLGASNIQYCVSAGREALIANGWTIEGDTQVCPELFGYYPLDNGMVDESGNGYDGDVFIGEPTNTTDRFGLANTAYSFDGDDYFQAEGLPVSPQALTISSWFRSEHDFSSASGTIVDLEGGAGLYISQENTFGGVLQLGVDNWVVLTTETSVNDGLWHHGAIVFDGENMNLYFDGELLFSLAYSGEAVFNLNPVPMRIGYAQSNVEQYFTGDIDDVRYHSIALSPVEIEELYFERDFIEPRESLMALYNSTGGENWTNNTNWGTEEPISTWHGVTIENGNVTRIDLRSNNLTGVIPPEIGNLTTLTNLILLSNPSLGGTIPAEIGDLINLTLLEISFCEFEGELPSSISNLNNLTYLAVRNNNLVGGIPAGIADIPNLSIIAFNGNQFTSLPNFTANSGIGLFFVFDNKFGFQDLIDNLPTTASAGANYRYNPQTIEEEVSLQPAIGELVELSTSETTSGTQYQWLKNGEEIEGANDATFSFEFISEDEGEYSVSMTNENIPDLTITRASYLVNDGVNAAPTGIILSDTIVREGVEIGTAIGEFITEDVDVEDIYTYELSLGDGDTHNDLFDIVDGNLVTAAEITLGEGLELSIRIKSTDSGNDFVEEVFTIIVWPIQVCNNEVLTAESGTFSDGSGEFTYDNDFSCSWLIEIPSGQLRLEFTEFETELNYDFVRIYAGSDESGTLLGQFSGSVIPEAVLAPSNQLFVTFTSDQIISGSGWTATYSTLSPVAYYPFDGNALDESGNGNDGTSNSNVYVNDRFGIQESAIDLDGNSQFIQSPATLISNEPFSITTWVYWRGNSLSEIVSWFNDNSSSQVYLGPQSNGELRFGDSFGVTGAILPQNEWVHVGATFDGATAKIYLNGSLVAEKSDGLNYDFAGGDLYVGRQGTGNFEYFAGWIDDLRLYDLALSDNDISNIFTAEESEILAIYSFNNNRGDGTGNEFDGSTISGGFTPDRLGQATAYEFVGDPMTVNNFTDYDFGDEITITGWIRPENFATDEMQLVTNTYNGSPGIEFRLVKGDLSAADATTQRKLWAGITGISYGEVHDELIIKDRWTHVAMRFVRGQGTSIFINGENKITYGFIPGTEDEPIPVSGDPIQIADAFQGFMDEITIYSTGLSDQEVLNNYESNRWPFHTLAFRGPEGQGENTLDRLVNLDPFNNQTHLQALLLELSGNYQFRATADEFEAFMGDNEMDNIAEPGGTQINLSTGFYAVTFDQNTLGYLVEPITSVGILGSALTGDDTGWNEDIDLTDLGNGIYQIQNVELFDGEFKLRPNDTWDILDWGDFANDGTLDYRGSNIPITAGTYTLTFDLANNLYTIIESGSTPVAFLEFDEDLIDDSGFGNNGQSAASTFVIGRLGEENTSIQLASSDEINLGNDPSLQLSNGFTMNIWVNPTVNDNAAVLFQSGNSFHNHLNATDMSWRYFQDGVEYQIDGIPITTSVGSWNMITWTYDGGTMKFYDDGVLVHSETVFGDLDIPGNNYVIGAAYEGAVDGFQWIDGALSEKEVKYLYTEGKIFEFLFDGDVIDNTGNNISNLPNGGSFGTDRFGNPNSALTLDGTSQYLRVGANEEILIDGNAVSFAGWFKVSDFSNAPNIFGTPGLFLYINEQGVPILSPQVGGFSASVESSVAINTNEWFHFAGTFDKNEAKVYVNGAETASQQLAYDFTFLDLSTDIGAFLGGSAFLNGSLDDVTLWNKLLTPSEIQDLAAEGEFFGSSENDLISFGIKTSLDNPEFEFLGSFNGSDYYLTTTTALWNDQKVTAEEVGGQIAVINSQEENDFITGLINEAVFIGLSDQNSEGEFIWVDGSPLTYENWANGEPNGGTSENYAEVLTDGFWNDLDESQRKAIIENPSQQAAIDQEDGTVFLTVSFDTDLTQVAPVFAVSDNATAYVADEQQVNGQTFNDFTQPISYSIVAEDGFSTQDYLVTFAKDSVQGDSLALLALYEGTDGDNWSNSWDLSQPISTWSGVARNNENRVISIDIPDNNLTGEIPFEIGLLNRLTFLDIAHNNITGSIPAELWELTKLTELYMSNNQLSGSIPNEIGNLNKLNSLGLSFNGFTGDIPSVLGDLAQLQFLFLENNQFSGNIPAELGNLSNLIRLQLSTNNLSGAIPQELGGLSSLEFLLLFENELTGEIPVSLADIESLTHVYLHDNQLIGETPEGFASKTNLEVFQINSNQISSLPDLTASPFSEGLFVQDNKIGFSDLIANLAVSNYSYNPQVIGDTLRYDINTGTEFTMSANETTAGTSYQWQKDGLDIDGATESSYTLIIEVGNEGSYTVVMTNSQIADLTITRAPYVINRLANDETLILSMQVEGVTADITENNVSAIVPFGVDLTNLLPQFELSPGATISPDPDVAQDFTNPITYTVTAEDGVTTAEYIVTIDDELNTTADIEFLSINGIEGIFDGTVISVELPFGDQITSLKPDFILSFGATISPDTAVARDFTDDQIYAVTSEDGLNTQNWTISVSNALGNEAEIISIEVDGTEGLVGENEAIVVLPFGEPRTNLKPDFVISNGATISPDTSVFRDYTDPILFTVTAADNTEKEWTVTITNEENDATEVISMQINGVQGQITGSNIDVVLPFATPLDNLTAVFELSEGATISPDPSVARDYTSAVVYTVTSQDGQNSQEWTVNVDDAPNEAAEIESFIINGVEGTIDGNLVEVVLPDGQELTSLTAEAIISFGAQIAPNPSIARNYTNDQTFTVTAEDQVTSKEWTVRVTNAPSNAAEVISWTINGIEGDIIGTDISIVLPSGVPLTDLTSDVEVSQGATIDPFPGQPRNYTDPRDFTVTAADGTTQNVYTVTVTNEVSTAAEIISLSVDEYQGLITDGRVEVVIGVVDPLTDIKPEFEISAGATIAPDTTFARDFTTEKDYTITAEDGVTSKTWTVNITNAINDQAEIESLSINGVDGVITGTTIRVTLPFDTPINNLSPEMVVSARATVSPDPSGTFDFNDVTVFRVTAEAGNFKDWTVAVELEEISNIEPEGLFISNTVITAGASGKIVGTIGINDEDDEISDYTLSISDGADNFTINSSLQIVTTGELTPGNYTLEILAESTFHDITGSFTIEVIDASVIQSAFISVVNALGTSEEHYRIISVPTRSVGIGNFFKNLEATNLQKTWRILNYNGSSSSDMNGNGTLNGGVGYWFISSEAVEVELPDNAQPVSLNAENEFELTLRAGWNLIGNPFKNNISWTSILQYNIDNSYIQDGDLNSQFWKWNGGYNNLVNVADFEGGWVNNTTTGNVTIHIPNSDEEAGGRISDHSINEISLGHFNSNTDWQINLSLEDRRFKTSVSGVAFHPQSSFDLDNRDIFSPPAISKDIKLNLKEVTTGASVNKVPYQSQMTWKMEMDVTMNDPTIRWDQDLVNRLSEPLYLILPKSNQVIDMRLSSSIQTSDTQQPVMVHYGNEPPLPGMISLTQIYPNPGHDEINLRFMIQKELLMASATVSISDLSGKTVLERNLSSLNSLSQQINVDITGLNSGVYLLKIRTSEFESRSIKLIKQ